MSVENKSESPADWVMKVRTFRSKGDLESALKVCQEGLDSHPRSMDLLYTFGELKISWYNKTKKPEHLKKALISFEKLLQINPHHYTANLLAAQIYYKGRSHQRALEKVNNILKITPGDPKANQIKQAVNKSRTKAASKDSQAAGVSAEPVSEKIEAGKLDGLHQVEVTQYETLIHGLNHFSKLDGIFSIHLVDHAGIAIKEIIKSGEPPNNLAPMIADIFRASGFCTRKIGLGNFQRGHIQAHDVNMILVNIFYGILVLVMGPDIDMASVDKSLDRYVADIV